MSILYAGKKGKLNPFSVDSNKTVEEQADLIMQDIDNLLAKGEKVAIACTAAHDGLETKYHDPVMAMVVRRIEENNKKYDDKVHVLTLHTLDLERNELPSLHQLNRQLDRVAFHLGAEWVVFGQTASREIGGTGSIYDMGWWPKDANNIPIKSPQRERLDSQINSMIFTEGPLSDPRLQFYQKMGQFQSLMKRDLSQNNMLNELLNFLHIVPDGSGIYHEDLLESFRVWIHKPINEDGSLTRLEFFIELIKAQEGYQRNDNEALKALAVFVAGPDAKNKAGVQALLDAHKPTEKAMQEFQHLRKAALKKVSLHKEEPFLPFNQQAQEGRGMMTNPAASLRVKEGVKPLKPEKQNKVNEAIYHRLDAQIKARNKTVPASQHWHIKVRYEDPKNEKEIKMIHLGTQNEPKLVNMELKAGSISTNSLNEDSVAMMCMAANMYQQEQKKAHAATNPNLDTFFNLSAQTNEAALALLEGVKAANIKLSKIIVDGNEFPVNGHVTEDIMNQFKNDTLSQQQALQAGYQRKKT